MRRRDTPEIAITPLRQQLSSLWCSPSIAMETGCLQGAVAAQRDPPVLRIDVDNFGYVG
jgi:hypothetical protein